jgi:hypothetical protein
VERHEGWRSVISDAFTPSRSGAVGRRCGREVVPEAGSKAEEAAQMDRNRSHTLGSLCGKEAAQSPTAKSRVRKALRKPGFPLRWVRRRPRAPAREETSSLQKRRDSCRKQLQGHFEDVVQFPRVPFESGFRQSECLNDGILQMGRTFNSHLCDSLSFGDSTVNFEK